MLVFWRQRLVFLATPKTASTSIEEALAPIAAVVVVRPPHLKHTTVRNYRRLVAPYLGDNGDFELVALMREPRDWLGSWFRFRQRAARTDAKSTRGMSFDAFVSAYCQEVQPEFAEVGAQAMFLAAPAHKPVDHIFRYEDMGGFIAFMNQRLGCDLKMPQSNVSPPMDLDLSLSPATEARLREKCARDFALYDSLSAAGPAPSR
jgi:hypothetical protein